LEFHQGVLSLLFLDDMRKSVYQQLRRGHVFFFVLLIEVVGRFWESWRVLLYERERGFLISVLGLNL